MLKAEGYRNGQFGKNHLGDRNEHLPTVHGFDEFFGNLYHFNTQEKSEPRDYQRFAEACAGSLEAYEEQFGSRGVLHAFATDTVDETEMPRFGVIGAQTIEDTGPLTQERMKTFDTEEMIPKALEFMQASKEAGEPFFVWMNTSRMHLYTRLRDESRYPAEDYTSEYDFYGSGIIDHDNEIGRVLDWLDEQGPSDNTIVWYSTDNGPEHSSWPHGGTKPFRGDKMTNYEGGIRVPSVIRWPGVLPEGVKLNGIQAHEDMFTTLAVAAGVEDPVAEVREEMNQYIDGVNNLPYWKGETDASARRHIFHYYESQMMAVRLGPWKMHFLTKEDYYAPIQPQTMPMMYNLRADPYESYDDVSAQGHLVQKISWLFQPMNVLMAEHLQSLVDFPPVQGGASFDMSNIVEDFISKAQQ